MARISQAYQLSEAARETHVIQITFRWPPRELMPNYKRSHHWRKYRHVEKAYREECGWVAKALRYQPLPGVTVPMTIAFYPPDRRRCDHDSMVGAFKSGQDGFADGLGVDDHLFRPTYTFHEPVTNGKVVVTIE